MSNPFDFFEAIYCINLDHRKDRWELAQAEFGHLGILERVNRFPAILNKDGRLGLIQSNLEIIKDAKKRNLKNVLIFEDDVHFINDPLAVLEKAISQITVEWYLFYLGSNTHQKLKSISENLLLLKKGYATHALVYSPKVYDIFIKHYDCLNEITSSRDILDVWLSDNIQRKYPCLQLNPIVATQWDGFSDIENHEVDYSFIEERFKKNTKGFLKKTLVN